MLYVQLKQKHINWMCAVNITVLMPALLTAHEVYICGKLYTDFLCVCLLLQEINVVFRWEKVELEKLSEMVLLQIQVKDLKV